MDLWVERRIITTTSHVFSLKLLCKKDMYSVNHCVDTIKEFEYFFMSGFFLNLCTVNASNLVLHSTCYHSLMSIEVQGFCIFQIYYKIS
jgi:hypothetical protein